MWGKWRIMISVQEYFAYTPRNRNYVVICQVLYTFLAQNCIYLSPGYFWVLILVVPFNDWKYSGQWIQIEKKFKINSFHVSYSILAIGNKSFEDRENVKKSLMISWWWYDEKSKNLTTVFLVQKSRKITLVGTKRENASSSPRPDRSISLNI